MPSYTSVVVAAYALVLGNLISTTHIYYELT